MPVQGGGRCSVVQGSPCCRPPTCHLLAPALVLQQCGC